MSYNIRGATYEDGLNCWEGRRDLNLRVIEEHVPDVIGFQEMQDANLAFYAERLSSYCYAEALPYNREGRIFYNTIAWKSGSAEVIDEGGFYLSETPDRWSLDWGGARVHTVMWMRLRQDSHTILFLNTHLDHISEEARVRSAQLIAQRWPPIRDSSEPVVLMGDFNSRPDPDGSSVYGILTGSLDDTWTGKEVSTVHGFRGPDDARVADGTHRVDWILTTGLFTKSCRCLYTADPPLYPSDHFPLLADLRPPV